MDYDGKCRFPHGHNGIVEIVCCADRLDERGMVVDFGEIKEVAKKFIDENWDHRMLLRRDDPLVEEYQRRGEPIFLFDENPTAETFARYLYDLTKGRGLPVSEVRFHETPTSIAIYRGEP
jgi:6-pyruvoyltetrahydropterin/6-carboxytetrahydropterin synthase